MRMDHLVWKPLNLTFVSTAMLPLERTITYRDMSSFIQVLNKNGLVAIKIIIIVIFIFL